jgi:plasmid replication initiation protein
LEELRFFTDTTNLYEKTNDWKKRVLDVAKKKLDESEATDIRFTYKEIKKGRSIVGFKFSIIKTDKSHEYQNIMRQRQPSANWDMPLWATSLLKSHGIQLKGKSKEYALAFFKKYPEDTFKFKIEEYVLKALDSQKAVAPYLMKSIKNELGIK